MCKYFPEWKGNVKQDCSVQVHHREMVDQPLCPPPAEGPRNSQLIALATSSPGLLGSFSITLIRELVFFLLRV